MCNVFTVSMLCFFIALYPGWEWGGIFFSKKDFIGQMCPAILQIKLTQMRFTIIAYGMSKLSYTSFVIIKSGKSLVEYSE